MIGAAGFGAMGFSLGRVVALMGRYWYVLKGSIPRLLDIAYWPTVQMIVWGFMSLYLREQSGLIAGAFGLLIAAVLLWDVLFRGQLGLALCFLEDVWSRNLANLFVSPLRPSEMGLAMIAMSLVRTLIGIVPASILAIWFFGFSVYSLGLALVGFFFTLIMFGWAIGLAVAGLILRWGAGAENLAWGVMFAIMPLAAVYYPVAVLPGWLQPVAWAMPPAYAFEGMRMVLIHHQVDAGMMLRGLALDIVYLGLGFLVFIRCFELARRRGLILQQGE